MCDVVPFVGSVAAVLQHGKNGLCLAKHVDDLFFEESVDSA